MKLLDLFAGIGGFSLAAHWMGWQTVGFVEWDDFCQKVLAKNFPGVPIFGDITKIRYEEGKIITDTKSDRRSSNTNEEQKLEDNNRREWNEEGVKKECVLGGVVRGYGYNRSTENGRTYIGQIDIITGGFPCQPFSQAGKRKGKADDRFLWPEMLRIIREVKPTWVVGENVAGLISMEDGKTLDGILTDLENEGFEVESFVIPACSVGAWHRRDRIWIVAYNHSIRCNNGKLSGTKGNEPRCKPFHRNEGLDKDVSDTSIQGLQGCKETRNNGENIKESRNKQLTRCNRGGEYWSTEPELGRVVHGIPNRVDRLKSLGNAIVPQVAYEIFKAIDYENRRLRKRIY